MKTAMQQLLDIVNKDIKNACILKNNGFNNINDINTLLSTYNYFRIIIEKNMLEKEKDQILKAYEDGADHGMDVIEDGLDYIHSTEYYNETYK